MVTNYTKQIRHNEWFYAGAGLAINQVNESVSGDLWTGYGWVHLSDSVSKSGLGSHLKGGMFISETIFGELEYSSCKIDDVEIGGLKISAGYQF